MDGYLGAVVGHRNSYFSLWAFLAMVPYTIAAAPSLTLEQAIVQAHRESPRLQRINAAAEEASWKPLEAMSSNIPKLNFSVQHFFGVKYQMLDIDFGGPATFPEVYPKTQYSLGVSWTIFDGLKTPTLFSAARNISGAARLEATYAGLQLDSDVTLKFYRALGAQLLLAVAEQNVKTLDDHFQKAKVRLNGGTATQFDILRIKVQLEEATPEKIAADDNLALARQGLAQSMGLSTDDRPLSGELPVPTESAIPENLSALTSDRADIKALKQRAQAASSSVSAAVGGYLPKITLSAEKDYYNNNDYAFTTSIKDAYSIGAFLSWDIFDGGATLARHQQAVHQAAQAELAAREAEIRLPTDIDQWKRKFLYNVSLYSARVRAIEMADESVRLARLGFDAGVRTNTDVLDAELDLFRARAGVVRAQLDAAEAFLNLELALGRKF